MKELSKLTSVELTALREHEDTIRQGLKTFAEVGTALLAIRDARLYRAEFTTFEDYCRAKWGMTRMHAGRMIAAADVMKNVTRGLQTPLPTSERQARPLSKLPADEQPEAWQEATDKASSEGRKVTARDVEQAVDARRPPSVPVERPFALPGDPLPDSGEDTGTDQEEGKPRDPTDTTVSVSDGEVDTPTLYQLKRYWRQANKREKTQFKEWIK